MTIYIPEIIVYLLHLSSLITLRERLEPMTYALSGVSATRATESAMLHRPTSLLMCKSQVCQIHYRLRPATLRLALVCWIVVGPQARGGWCNLLCDWHISGDVGRRSVADSVACVAETLR